MPRKKNQNQLKWTTILVKLLGGTLPFLIIGYWSIPFFTESQEEIDWKFYFDQTQMSELKAECVDKFYREFKLLYSYVADSTSEQVQKSNKIFYSDFYELANNTQIVGKYPLGDTILLSQLISLKEYTVSAKIDSKELSKIAIPNTLYNSKLDIYERFETYSPKNFITLDYSVTKQFKYDSAIIFLIISYFIIWVIWNYKAISSNMPFKREYDFSPPHPSENKKASYVDFLNYDVLLVETKANELYKRSTLMLISGLVMAFVGIIVFYFMLSQQKSIQLENWNTSDIVNFVRPFTMLIFIESIAWFLLRQYRVLINDYKEFYRLFMKRLNYNVAFRFLKDIGQNEMNESEKLLLATTLLHEDNSGKLKDGESLDTIEDKKMIGENPVSQILHILTHKNSEMSSN